MKRIIILMICAALFTTGKITAQTKKETQVINAVNELKAAMISGDSARLAASVSDELSYGHSGGKIEGKAAFVQSIASGRSDFVTIELSEQTVNLYKNTAVVRHILNATTNDNGKPGTVKLSILTVWNKKNGQWKMVARQAVRPQ